MIFYRLCIVLFAGIVLYYGWPYIAVILILVGLGAILQQNRQGGRCRYGKRRR